MDPAYSVPPPAPAQKRIDRAHARELGRERVVKRRERISRIRKRIIAGSAATFVTAWAAIFFQLASGHDPALTKNAQASTVASSSNAALSSSSSDGSDSSSYDDSYSSASNNSSTDGTSSQPVTPVTTQQS